MAAKQNRKRLYVDKKVQGSLLRQLVFHWVLACFLIFLYLVTMETLRSGFEVGFYDNITAVRKEHGMLFLIMLVISPVFIYDSVKLSNRFVGPMISFRAALNKLSNGEDPGEIRFRQNDFWKELTNDFNKISGELNQLRGNADDSPSSDEPEATVSA